MIQTFGWTETLFIKKIKIRKSKTKSFFNLKYVQKQSFHLKTDAKQTDAKKARRRTDSSRDEKKDNSTG